MNTESLRGPGAPHAYWCQFIFDHKPCNCGVAPLGGPQAPTAHLLKCHPAPFHAIRDEIKGFEYRKNDRNYKVGDTLELMEWDPEFQQFTGEKEFRRVDYLISEGFGIPPGYCIMSWRPAPVAPTSAKAPRECWVRFLETGLAVEYHWASMRKENLPKERGGEWVRMVEAPAAPVEGLGRAWNALADVMHILSGVTGSTPKDQVHIDKAHGLAEEAHGIIQRSFSKPPEKASEA